MGEDLHKATKSSRAERLRSECSLVHAEKLEFNPTSACDFYSVNRFISVQTIRGEIFDISHALSLFFTKNIRKIIRQILRQINTTFDVTPVFSFSWHFVKITRGIPET